MRQPSVLVLTYHSISGEPGPTSMPADVFRMQMDELRRAGYRSLTVRDFIDWMAGRKTEPARRVLITFDDGFADFERIAHPILKERGLSSLMFVPTSLVGTSESWAGANTPARPLMDWKQIKALAKAGVEFGSHAMTHPDLTALSPQDRREEIERSADVLADHLGVRTLAFAAPYGRVNKAVLADIQRTYAVAFGVRFDRAHLGCDPIDVPRIEMHYFRDAARWRDFLEGGELYFRGRKMLRGVRTAAGSLLRAG